jgi:hypothetical protein
MITIEQVKYTLDLLNEPENVRPLVLTLKLNSLDKKSEAKLPQFYQGIYDGINYVLEQFRSIPQGMTPFMKGLDVKQIGYVMDKSGDSWPDFVIAQTIQYQLLITKNKFYSLQEIMKMKFKDL